MSSTACSVPLVWDRVFTCCCRYYRYIPEHKTRTGAVTAYRATLASHTGWRAAAWQKILLIFKKQSFYLCSLYLALYQLPLYLSISNKPSASISKSHGLHYFVLHKMVRDSNYCIKGARKLTSVNYFIQLIGAGLPSGSTHLAVLLNCRTLFMMDRHTGVVSAVIPFSVLMWFVSVMLENEHRPEAVCCPFWPCGLEQQREKA